MLLFRFPAKRSSTAKQEPQMKQVEKPVKEAPSQRARGRRQKKQEEEEEEEEEEAVEDKADDDKEDVLRKREKNIQEYKAMVMGPQCFRFLHVPASSDIISLWSSAVLSFSWLRCLLI